MVCTVEYTWHLEAHCDANQYSQQTIHSPINSITFTSSMFLVAVTLTNPNLLVPFRYYIRLDESVCSSSSSSNGGVFSGVV